MAANSSPDILLTILGFLPFVLAILVYISYLLFRARFRNFIFRMDLAGAGLRRYRKEVNQFKDVLEGYSPQDPEPFGSLVVAISEHQIEAEQSLRLNYQRYTSLREQIHNWDFSLSNILQLPTSFFRLDRQISLLERNLAAFNLMLSPVRDAMKVLEQIHVETANRCKKMIEAIQTAHMQIQQHPDNNLTGEDVKRTVLLLNEWEQTLLQQIPIVFLTPDQEQALGQMEKQLTARVYRLLDTAQPVIQPMVERVQLWHSQMLELLENNLLLGERLNALAEKISQVENQESINFKWGKTKEDFLQLSEQVSKWTSAGGKMTPQELQKRLENTRVCQRNINDLEKCVHSIQNNLEAVQQLFQGVKTDEIYQWLDGTHALMHNVTSYHPKNWPDAQIPQLRENIKKLDELKSAYLGFAEPGISEKNLSVYLRTLRQLSELYHSLRPDIAAIQVRYLEIQVIEQNLRQELITVKGVLQHLQSILNSNPFLTRQAGNKLRRYLQWLETDLDVLQSLENCVLEEIRSRSEGRFNDLSSDLKHWLSAIHDEVTELRVALIKDVQGLYELVSMDDLALLGVSNALQEELEIKDQNQTIHEMIYQIKQHSDLWQRLIAAGKAVQDTMGPVMDRYWKTEKFRKKVNKLMEDADQIIPEILAWPPTTSRLTRERLEYKQLEKRWDSLRQERNKALNILAILSDLSDSYQSLENRLRTSLNIAKDEQKKVTDLEARLESSKKEWVSQSERNKENKSVVNGVRDLLEEVDQENRQIIKRYQSGAIQYHQAFQGMRHLCRKLDDMMVAVDNQHVIDINGLIQRRPY